MTTLARKTAAVLAVIAALAVLAGCTTSPQKPWFEHLNELLWYNAAD